MRSILYAFFSESSVPKTGSAFRTTTEGLRIRTTHVSRDMKLSEWYGPVIDEYGRVLSEKPEPLPVDIVFVGQVWSDSHAFDPDHMDPNLSYNQAFLDSIRKQAEGGS